MKVLFFISRDYGELFNAVYFSTGADFESVFLLPPSLHAVNSDVFESPVYLYEKAADVRNAIEIESPDLVLLFSGYLYVVNKVLQTEKSLTNILDFMEQRNIPYATSDPSLGLLTDVSETLFNDRHPRYRWMIEHFSRLAEILADKTHLYLAPRGLNSKAPHLSYFNSRFALDSESRTAVAQRLAATGFYPRDKATWLFILSPEDYNVQAYIHGAAAFFQLVCSRLDDAVKAGRQAVLIAPPNFVERYRNAVRHDESISIIASCSFSEFMDRLVDAEYAFYWNQFSASIVGRVLNRAPFFTFDKGHLAYAMKPLFDVGVGHFYPECSLRRLDLEASLREDEMLKLARHQMENVVEPMRSNFADGVDPNLVIERLIGNV